MFSDELALALSNSVSRPRTSGKAADVSQHRQGCMPDARTMHMHERPLRAIELKVADLRTSNSTKTDQSQSLALL